MNILVIGSIENQTECRQKFGATHAYDVFENRLDAIYNLAKADVVFDFVSDPEAFELTFYNHCTQPVFLNCTFTTLSKLIGAYTGKATFIGFCGLPTFLNRESIEVCVASSHTQAVLEDSCKNLGTAFGLVADQVGFVTPRIICMIINEAYYTVEEGTASREDIDLAMQLGTNYPYGPFEWASKIGLKRIVSLLNVLEQSTANSRYAVCRLLQADSVL